MQTILTELLGLSTSNLSIEQMCLRAIVVYVVALLLVRLVGSLRFAGQYAAIDIVLSIILGATLSRAIVGAAEFVPTLAASVVLVGTHWLIARLAFQFSSVEKWTKGTTRVLIQEGQTNQQVLKRACLTRQDLSVAMRSQGFYPDRTQIERAVLEPNGKINIVLNVDK